jgi:DNA repair exonuclease SbcCD ATPase subunit
MDESAIERAKQRIEQRADAAAVDEVLERTRAELAALADAAAEAAGTLPARVENAVQDGLREQVLPVGRNLAEIRGLTNQAIRRLETLEGKAEAERHERVDDLALLVDLISSGWQNVDARLGRIEETLARLEQRLEASAGATVYRLDDRRPDAANS